MNFEQEYKLELFKEVQGQYFDNDGKCYTGVNLSANIMEQMLDLIDTLSERLDKDEPSDKHQTKVLSIQSVVGSFVYVLKAKDRCKPLWIYKTYAKAYYGKKKYAKLNWHNTYVEKWKIS